MPYSFSDFTQPRYPLPLIPVGVRQRFHVDEACDTRFSACARLLQSLWRERRSFEIGRHRGANGRFRKLGSRLSPSAARTGVGFLTADIAKTVRREVAYREVGALIEERRLWENLLSSQGVTFNLFARARADRDYASRFFARLFPHLLSEVDGLVFEHSPGRGDPRYLGDHTALDLLVTGTSPDGARAFIAIEVKYSESMRQPGREGNPRYRELIRSCGLHIDPNEKALLSDPLAQLTAEHLLAAVMRDEFGPSTRCAFVTIAPAGNREAWNAIKLYQRSLVAKGGNVAFLPITLETVIETIRLIGDVALADLLHERYTDFSPVHALIEDWEPFVDG